MYSEHVKLFEDLMSGDKGAMSQAEEKIKAIKSYPMSEGVQIFLEGMKSDKAVVAQLATLMLKKTYLDDNQIVQRLKTEEIEFLKTSLKQFISFEGKDWKNLQRIADALAKLYAISDLGSSFSEIMTWFQIENVVSKRFAIYLIEAMCELSVLKDEIVKTSVEDFKGIFKSALSESDLKVRVTALQAATQFLNNLKTDEVLMMFTPLAENILESLIYVLKYDQDIGKAALIAMNSLTENHPKFWKQNLEVLIQIITEIAKEGSFPNEVRESALEVVYGIAKKSPAFLRKSPNFSSLFMPLMFHLLLDINDPINVEAWNKETAESERTSDLMFFGVRDGLTRLSADLGGKTFSETTIPFIIKYLSSDNWIELHAAFVAIGFMAQGCKEVFKSNIVELLNYISNGLANPHPRVVYGALTALAMLFEELAPLIQKKFHSNVIPALCKLMEDKESTLPVRVRTQACFALVCFLRGMIVKESKDSDHDEATKIIKPYAELLLHILSSLFEYSLNSNYAPLQEESLTALSLMATIMDKEFSAYYTTIMPGLKQVFYNLTPQTPQQAQLKSNAIETISYLCSSISENSENFMEDLKELSSSFAKLLSSLKEEDPQVPSLLTAFSHISTSMREKFYPYLEMILPVLDSYITADIGFKLEDADLGEYMPEDIASKEDKKLSVVLNLTGMQNTKLTMNTYALQNKIMALNVLHEICLNMGDSFNPFLERYLTLTRTLLQFPYSRKVRKLAIKSLHAGLLTCKDAEQQKSVFQYMGSQVSSVLEYNIKGRLLREIKTYLKVLINACEEIENKNVYPPEFIVSLYQSFEKIIIFVEEHKQKVKDLVKNDEGLDENDEEILESDVNILNETNRRVMELNGLLFKVFKEDLAELVNKHLFNLFLNMWINAIKVTKNDQEVLSSICFFCDYMNYSTQENFNSFYKNFVEYAVDAYPTKNEDVIQSAVYGLGVVAQRCSKSDFAQVKEKIVGSIVSVMARKVTDENSYSFDNAVSSLGKYVYFQCELDNGSLELASQFVNLLPLRYDLDEGESVLKLFLQQLLNKHPLLVNDVMAPKIKEAIMRMIEFKKEEEIFDPEGLGLFIEVCLNMGITADS